MVLYYYILYYYSILYSYWYYYIITRCCTTVRERSLFIYAAFVGRSKNSKNIFQNPIDVCIQI